MKARALLAVLTVVAVIGPARALEAKDAAPERIRIGVDIRLGLQAAIDYWTPVTEFLSKAIPEHRFVIVPLASQQDVVRVLENGEVDFLALDPALEVMAEDRYGVAPLATMVEANPADAEFRPAEAAVSGAIIRRADRSDIRDIRSLRGLRLSAVKAWSLTGWFAQWGLLAKNGIHPGKDLKQVVFEGTHSQVVKSVLDGTSDVGAVESDILHDMLQNQRIPANSLFVFNRDGFAVPLTGDPAATSTADYPGRVVSKVAATADDLAKRVADALMKQPISTALDGMPCKVRWSVASNNSKVRHLLQTLLGPQFAESDGYPSTATRPKWLFPLQMFGIALAGFFLASAAVRNYYRRRDRLLTEELDDTRRELAEVRAENQRINTILALAGCGIDIVDDQNQIVYADSSLEHKYGDWHGHTCHDYFCGSDTPCPGCRRPFPINEHCQRATDPDCTQLRPYDAVGKFQLIQGEATRMIGVPFRDEGGRWLYARVHLPLALVPEEEQKV